jgi:DNA-3-methyladenine glycosylase I
LATKDPDKMCDWPGDDKLMQQYHDEEWGVPVLNDKIHFEYMVLDSFQAGLSWKTILHRRKGFKKAFANFNYKKVAAFTKRDIARLMKDDGIIKNRQKIEACVSNAALFMDIQKEFGSFNRYIWQFVGYKPIHHKFKHSYEIPATSPESDAMAKDLKKRGFKFCGSTICYAYMQAAGMVNDHLMNCPRYSELSKTKK